MTLRTRLVRWGCTLPLLACSALQIGCGFASLERVLARGHRAMFAPGVTVTRSGAPLSTTPGMKLEKGDEIRTDADSTVIIAFRGGSEVIMQPRTTVRLGSVTVLVGEVLASVRGWWGRFEVETVYTTAGAESTVYLVTVRANEEVSVVVLEGVVKLASKTDAWQPVRLRRADEGTVRGHEPPRTAKISDQRFNEIIRWANGVQREAGVRREVLMPNLVGLRLEDARALVNEAGLGGVRTAPRLTGRTVGTVVDQQPEAGARTGLGAAVTLGVEAEPVRVPSATGRPISSATRMLNDARLSVGRVQERLTGTASAGTVIEQNPRAGAVVAVGSSIDLVVEAESVIVPNVVGQRIDRAQGVLQRERLRVGGQTEEMAPNVAEGTVLRQRPPTGQRVLPGTAVDLSVAVAGRIVPDVSGLSFGDARFRLQQAGLDVGSTRDGESDRDVPGTVMGQDPPPGTRLPAGQFVNLVIARRPAIVAPAVPTPVAPRQCHVPNLGNKTVPEATRILRQSGLKIGTVRAGGEYYRDKVSGQQPAAGTVVPCGTAVDLFTGVVG